MEKPRVLISVTNKTGIPEFALELHKLGWEIVSTGGTAKVLRDSGTPCTDVADVTGFPEMLGGRLKTIHPKIVGGVIAKQSDESHMADLEAHNIGTFAMVVVNLYDFKKNPSVEQIDVGGPNMLRAAAKNHESVIVVVDPADYTGVLDMIKSGKMSKQARQHLATKAFWATADYDTMIAVHFEECDEGGTFVEPGTH